MPINLGDLKVPHCPLCQSELTYLGVADNSQPFGERLSFFLGYALQKWSLLFYLIVTAVVAEFLPPLLGAFSGHPDSSRAGITLLSLFLLPIMYGIVTKYLFTILTSVSEGEMKAPSIGQFFRGDGSTGYFKVLTLTAAFDVIPAFLLFGLPFVLMSPIMAFGLGAFYFVMVLWFLMQPIIYPAMIIVLTREESLTAALSPLNIKAIISAMGKRYLILIGGLLIAIALPWAFVFLLPGDWSLTIPVIVFSVARLYFLVVMFAMMGYAARQYQDALDSDTDDWKETGLEESDYISAKARASSEIYVREGRYAEALETLKEAIKAQPQNMILRERYQRLLQAHGAPEQGGNPKS